MKKRYPGLSKQMMILGLCLQTTLAAKAMAAPTIPGYYGDVTKIAPALTALPTGGQVMQGAAAISNTDYGMLVDQETPKVVIHWKSFDLGETRTIRFDQQSNSWAALNRVTGSGYSKIFGTIQAQGRVYILNQNGILFGPKSQINVHSLTASALNLDENQFFSGPDFAAGGSEVYTYDANFPNNAFVANYGAIQAGNLGSVFLIGPQVENHGTISAPGGDIGLLAGGGIKLYQYLPGKGQNTQFQVVKPADGTPGVAANGTTGVATNYEGGSLVSDQGWTGMYGSFVNQEGLIRAVTALQANGRIILKASNTVHTGANSVTGCPIYESDKHKRTGVFDTDTGERMVVNQSAFQQSRIDVESDGTIEHYGKIIAPGGNVALTAKDRVYLDGGSSIDVSGSVVNLTAADHLLTVQLNSNELRDAFALKNGPLKGQTVTVDTLTGLPFADISAYLNSMEKSALELTTRGGTINLKATGDNGEVIVKQGAVLDISGGGLNFGAGLVQGTKVRIGQRIYDLADVPLGVPIDEVMDYQSHKYERYGLQDDFYGLFYGGSSAFASYLPAFWQGADAGSLTIMARKVVLDGTLNASAVRGIYQNALSDPTDANGNLMATGQAMPKGGSLTIGDSSGLGNADLRTEAIAVKKEVAATGVAADGVLADHDAAVRVSEISADRLNAAGLGSIQLLANNSVVIAPDATLIATGPMAGVGIDSSRIEDYGAIRAAGGTVNMTIQLIQSSLKSAQERIFLADTSSIDVSGQRLDNSKAGLVSDYKYGLLDGGTVALQFDRTDKAGEVIMARGAVIDVSGGYSAEPGGGVKGGDAGMVSFDGGVVRPDGQLKGLALEGSKGGTISIQTAKITVAPGTTGIAGLPGGFGAKDALPPDLASGELVLADNRFSGTGFSNIILKSAGDLVVEQNAQLAASSARLARPVATGLGIDLQRTDTVSVRDELAGDTSLALVAGQGFTYALSQGKVVVEEGAALAVAPRGTIALTASQGDVAVAGTLTAHGGAVNLTATGSGNVTLASTARLDASGTALPDPAGSAQPLLPAAQQVVDGGTIGMAAGDSVTMEQGSVVDVSGSEAVTNTAPDNKGGFVKTTLASAPGAVNITYSNNFNSQGTLLARARLAGLPGGSLTLTRTQAADDPSSGLTSTMKVTEDEAAAFVAGGFDALTFSSARAIEFDESVAGGDRQFSLNAARSLTLNATEIRGQAGEDIRLSSPWLRLTNIVPGTTRDLTGLRVTTGAASPGTATLAAAADFIDIIGNVALSGFRQATLAADRDIRLFAYDYHPSGTQNDFYSGALRTGGDLVLQGAAIYPGMYRAADFTSETQNRVLSSAFSIQAGDGTNGWRKITIEPPAHPENRQPIYSAGGALTLEGGDIDQEGTVAAPMGTLTLLAHEDARTGAKGRIYLADGSHTSILGEAQVLYGTLDTGQWSFYTQSFTPVYNQPVTSNVEDGQSPVQGMSLQAKEIIQAPKAQIDLRGNDPNTPQAARAGIFAYEFLPGFDGTNNPLTMNGRAVIMPDNSVVLPGRAVYLEGVEGVPTGTYSLLPAEYAFLPGAKVIEFTGRTMLPGEQLVTPAGYTMTGGYATVRGTTISSPVLQGILVRNASDVLAEGKFDTKEAVAGNAGNLTVSAATTILAGPVLGQSLPGYAGTTLQAAGQNIVMGTSSGLPDSSWWQAFDFDTGKVPDAQANKLILDTANIGGQGGSITRLALGDANTKTISLDPGASLNNIAQVYLTASDTVGLGEGASITALGDDVTQGQVVVSAARVTAARNSSLRASDLLQLNTDNLMPDTFLANLAVDHGTLGFAGKTIFVEPAGYSGVRQAGIHLAGNILGKFGAIDNVVLASRSDLVFLGDVDLEAGKDLTLDAARITVANNGAANTVKVGAGNSLSVKNSGAVSGGNDAQNLGTIDFSAKTITFGPGNVTLDNFRKAGFTSSGETVFNGQGTLTADLDANGILSMEASRFVAALTPQVQADGSLVFNPANFTVTSGPGDLAFSGNGNPGTGITAMPGTLTLTGMNITLDKAVIDLPSGGFNLQATGDIAMTTASILARGGRFNFPITLGTARYDNIIALAGGQVAMASTTGKIAIDGDSVIDTSATDGLDGGSISLAAATGGVDLASEHLKGDSFGMDTNTIGDFGQLARTLSAGGFTQQINLRARQGDVTIGKADASEEEYLTVTTEHFKLVADGTDSTDDKKTGNIAIYNKVDASAAGQGGTIEIYAQNDLNLKAKALLLAEGKGDNAEGGQVFLSSEKGAITTEKTEISVPDSSTTINPPSIYVGGGLYGKGGTVTYRVSEAKLTDSKLDGLVMGAASQTMLSLRTKNLSSVSGWNVDTELRGAKTFLTSAPVTAWRQKYPWLQVLPEIRFWSSSSMSLSNSLDTLAGKRIDIDINNDNNKVPDVGPIAGVLDFLSAQDLTVKSDIIDSPTGAGNMPANDGKADSWALNFGAGVDLTSADPMTVKPGTGTFTLDPPKLIYTESAPITIVSGGDATINAARSGITYMPGTNKYSVATFDGDINLNVGGNLTLTGGVIQSAMGDIDVSTGKDLTMTNYGAIRTTGRAPLADEEALFADPDFIAMMVQYGMGSDSFATLAGKRVWDFRDGGNISISAGGNITGSVTLPMDSKKTTYYGWNYVYDDSLGTLASRFALLKQNGFDDATAADLAILTDSSLVLGKLGDSYSTQFKQQLAAALAPLYHSYQWSADYGPISDPYSIVQTDSSQATFGIATMAGGSVRVAAGGNIDGQMGAFKAGQVTVTTNSNLDGRFQAMDGDMHLTAKGSFGTIDPNAQSLVELGNSRLAIDALGNIELGMVRNPTLVRLPGLWDLTYSEDSGVRLNAALGDITLQGINAFLPQNANSVGQRLLPATLEATAGRDINIDSVLYMAPAARGNLSLIAARDIDGPLDESVSNTFIMSDADPDTVYGLQASPGDLAKGHAPGLLHAGDPAPVTVMAGRDIHDLNLDLPKPAEIEAQRDIRNLAYWGQNLKSDDVSWIAAGRDIVEVPRSKNANYLFMNQAGPGYFLVQAGNSLDLGNSGGIQSTGQRIGSNPANVATNPGLDPGEDSFFGRVKGADVGVIAGYDLRLSKQEFSAFFAQLAGKGAEFSRLMATGKEEDKNAAASIKDEMLADVIDPLLSGKQTGDGNISMTQSAMATNSGRDDLDILAAGKIDVGTTLLSTGTAGSSVKGLQTFGGGNINVFSQGTINVNESRVVTNFGGDIFLLSNHGDLNAGRGSKSAVSSTQSGYSAVGGKLVQNYGAPGVGSGVRTLTYDPDGLGPMGAPKQGDAYLIAWEGVVDAGEAGISAGDLYIAATKVLNGGNINFSNSGIGLPASGSTGPSLGALAGASMVSDTAKSAEAVGSMQSTGNALSQDMAKVAGNLNLNMVVVRFIGFEE